MERYKSMPLRLYDFMDEFDVVCPRCSEKALIVLPHFMDSKHAALACKNCHFLEKIETRIRYIPSGKAKCSNCQANLNLDIEGQKTIPEYINISCEVCLQVNRVSENWTPSVFKYDQQGISDPIFGLSLWYQGTVRGNVFWAYNQRHLMEIRTYVQAGLRERTTNRFKMTMVEKLPNFIKKAKHRSDVLKAIDRMILR